jgi:hypothetical protein
VESDHGRTEKLFGAPKPLGSGKILITFVIPRWTIFSRFPVQMSPDYKSEGKEKSPTTVILLQMKRREVPTGRSFRAFFSYPCNSRPLNLASACRLRPSASRPVIPKRGDKEYEPASGSNLQKHNLERARGAMFDALRTERTISKYESFHRVDKFPPDRVNIARQ